MISVVRSIAPRVEQPLKAAVYLWTHGQHWHNHVTAKKIDKKHNKLGMKSEKFMVSKEKGRKHVQNSLMTNTCRQKIC